MLFIGIDLGTSAIKLLLMDETGGILSRAVRSYPVSYPRPGWSEQNPEDWFERMMDGLSELLSAADRRSITGISFGGQMHGLVMLDRNDRIIRPAILWNDGRTEEETAFLNQTVGRETLSGYTGNIAFAGFTAPKLLWLQKHEPENYARIAKIMLPKDYFVYRLTGVHSTDPSDASGTLLFDVRNRRWSEQMLAICRVDPAWMPQVFESGERIGTIRRNIADRLGLGAVWVASGAGDNAAAAIGTGTVQNGACNLSLGTSGTIFIAGDRFMADKNNALHAFAHATGKYHLMGCILSAASCGKWWIEDILKSVDYIGEQEKILCLGQNPVLFLPYLMGERSPHNDAAARAGFIGISASTTREQLTQAVYEGVTFALRDSLEVARSLGLGIVSAKLCGGGAKSLLWRKMVADIFNIPIEIPAVEEGPALGAAMLAAVCCGAFSNVEEAARRIVRTAERVEPDPHTAQQYEERYGIFRMLYPALKPVFSTIAQAERK